MNPGPLGRLTAFEAEGKPSRAPGIKVVMSGPMRTAERLGEADRGLPQRTEERTSALERQITERGQAEKQLQTFAAGLLNLRDDEHRRLARELHDSAGQLVAALAMNTAIIGADPGLGRDTQRANAANADLLKQLSSEIRTLSHLLHPPLLDEAGLQSALPWYVSGFSERSNIQVELAIAADFGRLSSDLEITIFRLVQECLTNIHRHSGSATAAIALSRRPAEVDLRVLDYGRGTEPDKLDSTGAELPGLGIRGMRERVRRRAGSMAIDSDRTGTRISVVLPLTASQG